VEPHSRKIEELIGCFVSPEYRVLDVGCGSGINTSRLKRKTENITGFDVENYVKNEHKDNFSFVLGKKEKLPFNDNEFDLATSWDVIEHVEKDYNFLKEIYRVLKPDGLALISTPNRNRLSNRLLGLFGKKIEYPYYLGTNDNDVGEICHIREYTLNEFKELGKKAGFEIKKIEGVYLGFHGFIKIGLFKVPKIFRNMTQHIFIILKK
jgi:ubiquinone/menaquinone biosynthesis C-methylase UbiE